MVNNKTNEITSGNKVNMRFSYSSASTFRTCPYAFKLIYIDKLPRVNNFFAEYGTFFHLCFEKFFRGELEFYELSTYYEKNYSDEIKLHAPFPPPRLGERYKEDGRKFFDSFSFDLNGYEVLMIEEPIKFNLDKSTEFVAKPDLVLREKSTGICSLVDYKTANPFRIDKKTGNEVRDKGKIDGYYKQMYIYTFALRKSSKIKIDKISIWFPRASKILTIDNDLNREKEEIAELKNTISEINNATTYPAKPDKYFCSNICGVRFQCKFATFF